MWGISYPPEGNRSINRPALVYRIRQQLNGRRNGQPDGLREEWEDVRLMEENTTKVEDRLKDNAIDIMTIIGNLTD